MKKTISINISGIVFHIEEDGYEKLKNYLSSIQRYFSAYEDSIEIIADIEGRMAEIFLAKITASKQIISLEDVDKLIVTMGNVADFEAIEEEEDLQSRAKKTGKTNKETGDFGQSTTSTAYEQTTTTTEDTRYNSPKKLYRDTKRKLLGGVSAGIAHYVNVDPLWVRLLFLAFFLGLFFIPPASGFVLLLYIILWIVVPGTFYLEEDQQIKKLYRDPDKRVIGGVSSGLASYFGVDVTVIRLLFVLGIFLFGQGLIIYLVLWAITPEARTLTDKMQMQGEPVTLSNIESNIKKSLDVTEEEHESNLIKLLLFPFRLLAAIVRGLSQALGPIFRFFFDALRVCAGIFMVGLALTMLVALLVLLGVSLGWTTNYYGMMHLGEIPLELFRRSFPVAGFVFAFFSLAIPFLFVGLVGLMMIIRQKLVYSAVGWSLFSLWVIGLIGVGITAPAFFNGFRSRGSVEKAQTFDVGNKTLLLKLREAGDEEYRDTELQLEGYEGTQVKLIQYFKARGKNRQDAMNNAEMISYVVAQTDSVLTFDSDFSFKPNALFRNQELNMTLQIPYGQQFVMDKELSQILRTNMNGYDDDQLMGNVWKFSKDSALVCLTCKEDPRREVDDERDDNSNDDEEFTAGVYSDDDVNGTNERGEDGSEGMKFIPFYVKDFDKLDMGNAFVIEVNQGNEFKVMASGDRHDVNDLEVEVNEGTLKIGYDDNHPFQFNRHKRVTLHITMPRLRSVEFSGASRSTIHGFHSNEPIFIDISGASKSDINLSASSLDMEVSGASVVNIKGQSQRLKADISGASTLDTYELSAKQVEIEATGASTARVNAEESLTAEASGISNIHYRGNPRTLNNDTSGASSVKKE
ncbi:MAG: PspC domain-containing protein [Bacteroidota bacterium]